MVGAKKVWVDPPDGWTYGFPKVYDPIADGDMYGWLEKNGYPIKQKIDYLGRLFWVRQWEFNESDLS